MEMASHFLGLILALVCLPCMCAKCALQGIGLLWKRLCHGLHNLNEARASRRLFSLGLPRRDGNVSRIVIPFGGSEECKVTKESRALGEVAKIEMAGNTALKQPGKASASNALQSADPNVKTSVTPSNDTKMKGLQPGVPAGGDPVGNSSKDDTPSTNAVSDSKIAPDTMKPSTDLSCGINQKKMSEKAVQTQNETEERAKQAESLAKANTSKTTIPRGKPEEAQKLAGEKEKEIKLPRKQAEISDWQMANQKSLAPSGIPPKPATWECLVDGRWTQYPADVCMILEAGLARQVPKVSFTLNGRHYEVELGDRPIRQVNISTKYCRIVRRSPQGVVSTSGCVLPDHWVDQDEGQKCGFVTILPQDEEWKVVRKKLAATMPHAALKGIYRVQNPGLWAYFCSRRDKAAAKLSEGNNPNVVSVWHGTSQTDPLDICNDTEGFRLQLSRRGMWGKGMYFAEKASYSNAYAYQCSGQRKRRALILVLLVSGEETELPPDSSLLECPMKPGGKGTFDSVTGVAKYSHRGVTQKSKIYVVYENGCAYPEYVVTYE